MVAGVLVLGFAAGAVLLAGVEPPFAAELFVVVLPAEVVFALLTELELAAFDDWLADAAVDGLETVLVVLTELAELLMVLSIKLSLLTFEVTVGVVCFAQAVMLIAIAATNNNAIIFFIFRHSFSYF